MTDHLPECAYTDTGFTACICDRLRACEARAWGQGRADHAEAVSTAYGKGLDAAWKAIAALRAPGWEPWGEFIYREVLPAIDALRSTP
jgi:hypothetical protein